MSFPMRQTAFAILNVDRKVDERFSELIHKPWGGRSGPMTWQPAVDLYSTETSYLLEADLPGVLPADIELTLLGTVLQIRGFRRSVRFMQSAQSVTVERAHGEFLRQFLLTVPVDMSRLETQYENGIFRAMIPKKSSDVT